MKKTFLLFVLIATVQAAFAQGAPSLLVPVDARSLSLGGVMLPQDATKLGIQAFYGMWAPQSAKQTMIGGNVLFRASNRIALSAEARTFKTDPYVSTSPQGATKESFQPTSIIAGMGVSVQVLDALAVNVKGRILSSSIAEDAKGDAFCGDLTLAYTGNIVRASLSACNLGSKLSYGSGTAYALPSLISLQADTRPIKGLTVGAEVEYLFSGAMMAGLGAEYSIADIVSLRGGFHYGDPVKAIPMYASLGLGLQFAGAHLDIAFLSASKTLGNTLLISLGYTF